MYLHEPAFTCTNGHIYVTSCRVQIYLRVLLPSTTTTTTTTTISANFTELG